MTILAHQILYGDADTDSIAAFTHDDTVPDVPNGALVSKDRICLTALLLSNEAKVITAFFVMCHYGTKFTEEELFETLFDLDTVYMKKYDIFRLLEEKNCLLLF